MSVKFPLKGEGGNRAVTHLVFAHVTTKTYAYLGVFGFFRIFLLINNAPPPRPNHILKIQWEIRLLTFLNTDRNAPNFF